MASGYSEPGSYHVPAKRLEVQQHLRLPFHQFWFSSQSATSHRAHSVQLHHNCAAQEDHELQEQQGPGAAVKAPPTEPAPAQRFPEMPSW